MVSKSSKNDFTDKVIEHLLAFLSEIPSSSRGAAKKPDTEAKKLIQRAAAKAASVSGIAAIPPGPLGLLTIIPDLIAVWKIQAQLVADVAAIYGRTDELGREAMLYFLFKHSVAQVTRDLVSRVGERVVFKKATAAAVQRVLRAVGVKVTARVAQKGISRWVPVLGALAVGGYAYYDTTQVGLTVVSTYSPPPKPASKRGQSPTIAQSTGKPSSKKDKR